MAKGLNEESTELFEKDGRKEKIKTERPKRSSVVDELALRMPA